MKRVVCGALCCLVIAAAEARAESDPWAALRVFTGEWHGSSVGKPGKGSSTREYHFVLGNQFLYQHDISTYEATSAASPGVNHEDLGYFSYDKVLQALVWRQFHSEGLVNEYRLASVSADGSRIEFVTTRIENLPAGWRAKKVYRVVSHDQVDEEFWLAGPGQELSLYTQTQLKRKK